MHNWLQNLNKNIIEKLKEYEKLDLQLLCLTNLDLRTIVKTARMGNLYIDINGKKISLYQIGLTLKRLNYDVDGLMVVIDSLINKVSPIPKPYSDEDYEKAKQQGYDLDNWNDYERYFKLGEEEYI